MLTQLYMLFKHKQNLKLIYRLINPQEN